MTPEQKLRAAAGIRLRHPAAAEREVFLRYAMLTLGAHL